jgi:transposase
MASIVFQHHANGTDYAYMSTSYWDKDKKASRTKMICIGKKDPQTGEIIYNNRWKALQGKKSQELSEPEPPPVAATISIGPSLLLEAITKKLGLRRSLLKGFDTHTTDMLLSLSWFFASSSSRRAYLAEGWMESHRCPNHEHPLSSPRITELLQTIHRDQILSFFKSWLRRSTDSEYLCFDISSISNYGSNNAYVEYGYNRDGEHLSQINIALLSGMDSDIPFYYEILPGSLHDVSSLPTFLAMLGKLGMKRISLMMDKGFHSKKNLSLLVDQAVRFTMPVPKNSTRVKAYIDHDKEYLEMPGNILFSDERSTIYGITHPTKLNGKRIYYHIYTDTAMRIEHIATFNAYILGLSKELESQELVEEHQDDYEAFFTIKQTPKRGRKVIWDLEAIKSYRDRYVGYWALVTNNESDAATALCQYRKRDRVEKQFDSLKNMLDGKRLRTKGAVSNESIIFIRFLSLIITEHMRKILRETPIERNKETSKNWLSRYSVAEVFNRLESFTEVSFKNTYKPIHPEKTKAQREIFDIFGLKV